MFRILKKIKRYLNRVDFKDDLKKCKYSNVCECRVNGYCTFEFHCDFKY